MSISFRDVHRYDNPPERIPVLYRKLKYKPYQKLILQLNKAEILISYGRPRGHFFSACHITSESRMLEIESSWTTEPEYFAGNYKDLLSGFDVPFSDDEMKQLHT